jgi:DNA-binding GntR family transcriptional regulator
LKNRDPQTAEAAGRRHIADVLRRIDPIELLA